MCSSLNCKIFVLGIPNLETSLCCLTISCLERNEDFMYEDLEPLDICDFLFEEGAVDIPSHDRITERSQRRTQIQYLLETVQGNEHYCFRFFLYILHREGYTDVCQRLVNRTSSRVEVGMFYIFSIKSVFSRIPHKLRFSITVLIYLSALIVYMYLILLKV